MNLNESSDTNESSSRESATVSGIWQTYRGKIVCTMALLVAERLVGVATPFVLGLAINDLIAGSFRGTWFLIAFRVAESTFGAVRRLFDTRIYTRIYSDIGTRTASNSKTSVSKRAALMQLARELVNFFEWDLPQMLGTLIGVGGGFVMLSILSPLVGAISITVALLIGVVFYASRTRIFGLNRLLNSELERQVNVLELGKERQCHSHMKRLAKWRVHLSDLEAANFAVADIMLGALIVSGLVITVNASLNVGEIFAVLIYLRNLSTGLLVLPWTYQKWIRICEIGLRFARS